MDRTGKGVTERTFASARNNGGASVARVMFLENVGKRYILNLITFHLSQKSENIWGNGLWENILRETRNL